MNTIDITPIVQAVVALLAAVISAFLVPWIKRKASAAQLEQMEAWTRIAVAAHGRNGKGLHAPALQTVRNGADSAGRSDRGVVFRLDGGAGAAGGA